MSEWAPVVGDWVVYRPSHGASEDGEVTALRGSGLVMVLYHGDRQAKATHLRDLEPGAAT